MLSELDKLNKDVNQNEVELIPVNTNVVIEFYDSNPYRLIEKTDSGLILGIETTPLYKSNETGEMVANEECVACGKVVAYGPACKNVKVGDDVFCIKHLAAPIPFRKLGYFVLNEQNLTCIIRSKETTSGHNDLWKLENTIYSKEYIAYVNKSNCD